jgi:hypothetical protein
VVAAAASRRDVAASARLELSELRCETQGVMVGFDQVQPGHCRLVWSAAHVDARVNPKGDPNLIVSRKPEHTSIRLARRDQKGTVRLRASGDAAGDSAQEIATVDHRHSRARRGSPCESRCSWFWQSAPPSPFTGSRLHRPPFRSEWSRPKKSRSPRRRTSSAASRPSTGFRSTRG